MYIYVYIGLNAYLYCDWVSGEGLCLPVDRVEVYLNQHGTEFLGPNQINNSFGTQENSNRSIRALSLRIDSRKTHISIDTQHE